MGSFELVVMFFRMTNSSAMFQAMMNEILRDMINEGKVVAFVDDVLVGTETEEGHDEVVINRSFLLSHFHYSFSFNFFFCSIYSIGKYMSYHVTEGVTPSHQKPCHMSHHTSFG